MNLRITLVLVFLLGMTSLSISLTYDFEDPAQMDDWEVVGDATWEIKDGVLDVVEVPGGVPEGIWGQRLELKDVVFSDGTIEYKIIWVEGEWFEGGMYYRLIDGDNWYNTHISNFDTTVRWTPCLNADRPGKTAPIGKVEKDKWYEIKIVAEGDNHQVFVDGEELFNEQNGNIEAGKIAIGTWSGVVENWQVDDLVISGQGIHESPVEPLDKAAIVWANLKR